MGIVRVQNPANVQSVSALHQALATDIAGSTETVLDISGVEDADLSFLQLVEAARMEASSENKAFNLAQPANASLTALLERAGFVGRMSAADREFWFHGELPQ